MATSRSQSYEIPRVFIWAFMVAMFSYVQTAGCTPLSMAAFSAGRPKASHPIGCRTLYPRIRLYRVIASPMA